MFLSYFISELHAIYLFLGFREGFYFAHGYHADQEAMSQLTIIEETLTQCSALVAITNRKSQLCQISHFVGGFKSLIKWSQLTVSRSYLVLIS